GQVERAEQRVLGFGGDIAFRAEVRTHEEREVVGGVAQHRVAEDFARRAGARRGRAGIEVRGPADVFAGLAAGTTAAAERTLEQSQFERRFDLHAAALHFVFEFEEVELRGGAGVDLRAEKVVVGRVQHVGCLYRHRARHFGGGGGERVEPVDVDSGKGRG